MNVKVKFGFWKLMALYSTAIAILAFVLKFLEYKYFIRDLKMEVYLGVVAILFTAVGLWIGYKVVTPRQKRGGNTPFTPDQDAIDELALSQRELEVLELMYNGHSNQEIADRLFVSINTIKTHASNLFSKLDVKRRTQAIARAKGLGILKP